MDLEQIQKYLIVQPAEDAMLIGNLLKLCMNIIMKKYEGTVSGDLKVYMFEG